MKMMFAPVLEPGCSLHELRRSLNLAAACMNCAGLEPGCSLHELRWSLNLAAACMNCVGLKLFAKNKKVFACYMD